MDIDSEQDPPLKSTQTHQNHPTFEAEEGEFNLREPYLPILQSLDFPIGTAVLHFSFPQVLRSSKPSDLQTLPSLLQHRLVVVLACADLTMKLLTLPLLPPSSQSKKSLTVLSNIFPSSSGHGAYGEQIVTLNGRVTHQNLPKGVSVALVPRSVETSDLGQLANEVSNPYAQSTEKSRWDLLVASCSADVTGILLIHRIPLTSEIPQLDAQLPHQDLLWRVQYLARPAVSIELHVPLHSGQRRWPVVLIAEAEGAVRIYDCCSTSNPDQGVWSLSLRLNNCLTLGGSSITRAVLDAKWVFGGKAIIVLTSDSEWGVWDLGIDHESSGKIPISFATNGWVSNSSQGLLSSKRSMGRSDTKTKLAPMTPSTRRTRQKDLFIGPTNRSRSSPFGGISIYPHYKKSTEGPNDESILIWHGDKVIMIPSLRKHWQCRVKGSESLSSGGQIRPIDKAALHGETCYFVSMFPQEHSQGNIAQRFMQPDLLVTGERSLKIITLPLSSPQRRIQHSSQISRPMMDQHLLSQGELDVGGMDRILARMSSLKNTLM